MYNLPYYTESDQLVLEAFMRQHPFATICGTDASGCPVATQVPLLIDNGPDGFELTGHIMRKSSHHLAFTENNNVLALFTGPHCYVSASWYSNPRQGSTWNYMTVQARGRMEFLEDACLPDILKRTTTLFENNNDSPASFDKLPAEYVSSMSKAIAGFRIKIDQLENVFKLSQNRDAASYGNIIAQLQKGNEQSRAIAEEMTKRAHKQGL